ncbi:type II toxin-antitoxin system RelE/ParE family toxin [Rhizobium laguerreae]|nr:type II toxin-antitoxin system RelE/ParE family toxin [Rhizobium laguerreae]TBY05278.1 type II toxin-antitoxin system RelE/ParE family toxin [Rhizobium laguerreae]
MSFKLSAEAEEDIIAIAEQGVRMFGADQAKRYHDELFALFDLIAVNPRIARKRDEIDPPVRIHPFKAHLIVYRIENDETIFVIRFATRMKIGQVIQFSAPRMEL